jgi:hypothetical protein
MTAADDDCKTGAPVMEVEDWAPDQTARPISSHRPADTRIRDRSIKRHPQ